MYILFSVGWKLPQNDHPWGSPEERQITSIPATSTFSSAPPPPAGVIPPQPIGSSSVSHPSVMAQTQPIHVPIYPSVGMNYGLTQGPPQNFGMAIQPPLHHQQHHQMMHTTHATPSYSHPNTPQWLPASNGQVPPGAVSGGQDISGEHLFIARARYGGALIPGKLTPSHRCCYIAWGGNEHSVKNYEVLCSTTGIWIPASGANISPKALPGGNSENGETLYIGRANHNGTLTIGKVQPSHQCCYISYGGKEIAYKGFEVFVSN